MENADLIIVAVLSFDFFSLFHLITAIVHSKNISQEPENKLVLEGTKYMKKREVTLERRATAKRLKPHQTQARPHNFEIDEQ